jgi:hypothetical protein
MKDLEENNLPEPDSNDNGIFKKVKKAYKNFSFKRTLKQLVGGKQNFFVREGTEVCEIVFGKNHFLYSTGKKNIPKNKLFLFKKVQFDAKIFVDNNPLIVLPPKHKTQFYNLYYNESIGKITGTDLDHAFWRIAYVKGYISEKTYKKGLEDDKSKTVRLATLGVLGKERKYDEYVNGEFVRTVIEKKEDKALLLVYKDIRYTCYYMMHVLSQKLGDDFESWATDCIYYRDTPENRKLVHSFFEAHKMLFKQLSFDAHEAFK